MFQIAEVLKKVPFFQTLGRDGIDFIIERLKFKPYDADDLICQAGDPGDKMYMVINGEVKVVVNSEDGQENVIAYLGSGDYFGEMSLLTEAPRSASVITTKTSEMFVLNKTDFDMIIEKFPSITLSMTRIMSERLRETNKKAANAGATVNGLKGKLQENTLVDVLKLCESNSLNGKILLSNNGEHGELHYEKGELQKVILADLPEDQALDILLKWSEGEFQVEPRPLKLADEPGSAPPAVQPEPHRIIIVNNSMVVQKLLQRAFDSMGYEVFAIEKGSKALTMIKSMKPNLIISDTKLPDISGTDFFRSAREISQVPFVLLTEKSNRKQYEAELRSGNRVFFTNSQAVGEVVKVVEKALE